MKILATVPLHLMDVQVEIVKAFVYFVCKLAKYNDVTFAVLQAKKYKQFEEAGLLKRLEACRVQIKLLDKIISADKERKQMWMVDNQKIDRVLGSDYDLVLFYAYSISSPKQMKSAFINFYKYSEHKVTFNSMLTKYRQTYPLYYISRKYKIPTFQFIVDWLEPDLTKIYGEKNAARFGVYKHKELGVKFMPIYDMYIFRKNYPQYMFKPYDFVFGYTITYVGRKYLHNSLQNGIKETEKIKLFARDRYWSPEPREDVVPQDVYFAYISQAKFSYVVPANDKKEFSIQRFYECLSRRCIPLIDSRCILSNVFSDKQDILEFWKNNKLIVNLDKTTINSRIEKLEYNELIAEIMNLSSIKRLFNLERYEKFCKDFSKKCKKVFTNQ